MEWVAHQIPRGDVLWDITNNTAPENLTVVGDLLWVLTQILLIRVGFKQRTYGMPAIALGLNLSWEAVYTFVYPPVDGHGEILWGFFAIRVSWFLLNCIILLQILRWGKNTITIPAVARRLPVLMLALLTFGFLGYTCWTLDYQDKSGVTVAMVVNFTMSLLFVFMYFDRLKVDLRGISYGAAWAKMLGTAIIGVSVYLMTSDPIKIILSLFLFVAVAVVDATYVVLLHNAGFRLWQRRVAVAAT